MFGRVAWSNLASGEVEWAVFWERVTATNFLVDEVTCGVAHQQYSTIIF